MTVTICFRGTSVRPEYRCEHVVEAGFHAGFYWVKGQDGGTTRIPVDLIVSIGEMPEGRVDL